MEFQAFPKIARWFRDSVVSVNIDGTNAAVYIEKKHMDEVPNGDTDDQFRLVPVPREPGMLFVVQAASRNRMVTPKSDNFGFARWVYANAELLFPLGPGVHHGEWYGRGIQRGYGLQDRRFALFNAGRWSADPEEEQDLLPSVPGLEVVPVLYRGALRSPHGQDPISEALRRLQYSGSVAVPGFKDPEGVVVWHEAGRVLFKSTLDGNDDHKGL
jgi:hypothetical protein